MFGVKIYRKSEDVNIPRYYIYIYISSYFRKYLKRYCSADIVADISNISNIFGANVIVGVSVSANVSVDV